MSYIMCQQRPQGDHVRTERKLESHEWVFAELDLCLVSPGPLYPPFLQHVCVGGVIWQARRPSYPSDKEGVSS